MDEDDVPDDEDNVVPDGALRTEGDGNEMVIDDKNYEYDKDKEDENYVNNMIIYVQPLRSHEFQVLLLLMKMVV